MIYLFIDSGPPSVDVAGADNQPLENDMPQEADAVETLAEAPASVKVPGSGKRASREKKAKAQPKRPAERKAAVRGGKAAEAPAQAGRTGRKVYSRQERAQKLGQIEKSLTRGESLKSSVRQVGISEQTYYQWKRAAASAAPASDLKELMALEEENKRLKKQLAERLRQENAELRKRLGLK